MTTRRKKFRKHPFFISAFIIIGILFMGSLTACKPPKQPPVTQTGFHFDTVISITLYSGGDETVLDSCFKLADYYENLFSRTKEGSDIYRINHANGKATEIAPETAELLSVALNYATLTDGEVDPTIGSASGLWDFHEDAAHIPPDSESISTALTHVNFQNVQLSGNIVTLTDPETVLDLGFIAKGYIADKLKEHLLSEGVTSALINLGGNVLCVGSKPDNSAFTIGIQEPFATTGTPITTVSARDSSVVSSGVYERYYEYEDRLYHHILDTTTGYPVDNDLLAVSILSENSTDGDALSTICLTLGYEKAFELVDSLEDIEAIFITTDYEMHTTY